MWCTDGKWLVREDKAHADMSIDHIVIEQKGEWSDVMVCPPGSVITGFVAFLVAVVRTQSIYCGSNGVFPQFNNFSKGNKRNPQKGPSSPPRL